MFCIEMKKAVTRTASLCPVGLLDLPHRQVFVNQPVLDRPHQKFPVPFLGFPLWFPTGSRGILLLAWLFVLDSQDVLALDPARVLLLQFPKCHISVS